MTLEECVAYLQEQEAAKAALTPSTEVNAEPLQPPVAAPITIQPRISSRQPIITDRGYAMIFDHIEKYKSGEVSFKKTVAEVLVPIAVWIEYGLLWAMAALIICVAVDVISSKLEG